MTSRRDLGPVLAIAGLVAVLGALVAGFIVVGGPGDARDLRFDGVAMRKVNAMASVAQCSYATEKTIPKTMDELRAFARRDRVPDSNGRCSFIDDSVLSQPPEVEYSVTGEDRITLCADFRRPTKANRSDYIYGSDSQFEELRAERKEAGRHCFDVKLLPPVPMPS